MIAVKPLKEKLKYLITGTGRCGTVFFAKFLTNIGIPCGHESIFTPLGIKEAYNRLTNKNLITLSDISLIKETWVEPKTIIADSSYMAVPFLSNPIFDKITIIHVIRHPLKVISSFIKDFNFFSEKTPNQNQEHIYIYEKFIWEHLPELSSINTQLERACYYYTNWNRKIRSHLSFKIEDDYVEKLCNFLDVPVNEYYSDRKENSLNKTRKDFVLSDINEGKYKQELIEFAKEYNYDL